MCAVTVDGAPLRHVVRHSPTGFEWGYAGSGPADLALSILLDFTRDEDLAHRLHQDFKFTFVCRFPADKWTLAGADILTWLREHGAAPASLKWCDAAKTYTGARRP